MALTEKNEEHVIGQDLNQSLNQSIEMSQQQPTLRNVSSRTNLAKMELEQAKHTGE